MLVGDVALWLFGPDSDPVQIDIGFDPSDLDFPPRLVDGGREIWVFRGEGPGLEVLRFDAGGWR